MNESRRHAQVLLAMRRLMVAAFAAVAFCEVAIAQQAVYPSRPITIVVPHAAGGPVDSVGRLFARKLSEILKSSVIVENRAGASGMIGAAYVAAAQPDGYTLYINASIHSINPLLYKERMKFDSVKDFTAISLLAQGPLVFLVNPSVKATTPQEFAKEIKLAPDKINFGTGGFGAADHLASAYFLHEIGRVLNQVENRLSLSGHTDATQYAGGDRGFSNWELSASRANASRRELIAGGMDEKKVVRVVGLASSILFDKQDPTNPINRRISIIVMNKRTEEAILADGRQMDVEGAEDIDPKSLGARAPAGGR